MSQDDVALIVFAFVFTTTVSGAVIVISPESSMRTKVVGVCPQPPPR